MRVLSLFDGMACGMLAMMESGIPVDRYVAFEIDKYAIQTSTHNFPMIEQRGDVFKADFTEFKDFDYLIGGSPCQKFSIAQKNDREITPNSGLGWDLFSQYVRALKEAEPKYFLYENNKSMSNEIRKAISDAFGFEPICINSALVSAQNRQRWYWVGRRNADGTYSKVNIPQPEDRGKLLKDILEDCCSIDMDKAYCLKHQAGNARDHFKKHHTNIKYGATGVAERCCVAQCGRYAEDGSIEQHFEPRHDGKTNTITNVQKDNAVAEPVRVGTLPQKDGSVSDSKQYRVYSADGKSTTLCGEGGGLGAKTGLYALPVAESAQTSKSNYLQYDLNGKGNNSQDQRIYYEDGKAGTIDTAGAKYKIIEPCMLLCGCKCYAIPCKWNDNGKPTKAVSCADGKTYTVYEVADGKITIKGKTYPIKLADGFWIIRKLTVRECARLQTIPERFIFPVSDTQAYRQIGNGWTVQVISHLLNHTKEG